METNPLKKHILFFTQHGTNTSHITQVLIPNSPHHFIASKFEHHFSLNVQCCFTDG